jgi:hypothetical protein
MPTSPFVGGTMIPYIPAGVQPAQQRERAHFSNILKTFANQNICYSCGFDVEDWHTRATFNAKKRGHQDGFNCTLHKLYGVRTCNPPLLSQRDAQDNVPKLLTMWGGE